MNLYSRHLTFMFCQQLHQAPSWRLWKHMLKYPSNMYDAHEPPYKQPNISHNFQANMDVFRRLKLEQQIFLTTVFIPFISFEQYYNIFLLKFLVYTLMAFWMQRCILKWTGTSSMYLERIQKTFFIVDGNPVSHYIFAKKMRPCITYCQFHWFNLLY